MSYLPLSGRLSHQNWLSLLWLASNFDLSCPSLCCSMASGGLSTSIRSLCCSVDCQMSSQCCLCYPYRHHKTQIYTEIKPHQGRIHLYIPHSNPNKEKGNTLPLQQVLTPILICLQHVNTAILFLHAQHLPSSPFGYLLRALSQMGLTQQNHAALMEQFCCPLSVLLPQQGPHHFSSCCPSHDVFLTNFTCPLPLSLYPYFYSSFLPVIISFVSSRDLPTCVLSV